MACTLGVTDKSYFYFNEKWPILQIKVWHFDRSVYLLLRFCFVNELWECESRIDQCILYADFELDLSHMT